MTWNTFCYLNLLQFYNKKKQLIEFDLWLKYFIAIWIDRHKHVNKESDWPGIGTIKTCEQPSVFDKKSIFGIKSYRME